MALELSYVYIKYVYGKEKAEFQKPYSITDDNNCWKIEENNRRIQEEILQC
ncbi:NTF2 fold immunity protein [Escherichia coli]|nr:NTF2 fold immunity protein [Escherichia coli]